MEQQLGASSNLADSSRSSLKDQPEVYAIEMHMQLLNKLINGDDQLVPLFQMQFSTRSDVNEHIHNRLSLMYSTLELAVAPLTSLLEKQPSGTKATDLMDDTLDFVSHAIDFLSMDLCKFFDEPEELEEPKDVDHSETQEEDNAGSSPVRKLSKEWKFDLREGLQPDDETGPTSIDMNSYDEDEQRALEAICRFWYPLAIISMFVTDDDIGTYVACQNEDRKTEAKIEAESDGTPEPVEEMTVENLIAFVDENLERVPVDPTETGEW